MSYDDCSSEQAYQENVAQPDQRAWQREAEEHRVEIQAAGTHYRCVHPIDRPRPQSLLVEMRFSLQKVVVDVCAECQQKIKEGRNA